MLHILATILYVVIYAVIYAYSFFCALDLLKELLEGASPMPVAVVTISTKRFELKSLPEGYVVVRRMNYGERLLRAQQATRFLMGGDSRDNKSFQGELDIQTSETALWDFAHLVVEHNLQDENEQLLNFKLKQHVQKLDSAIGEEIGQYIDEWNDVEPESNEEVKNS